MPGGQKSGVGRCMLLYRTHLRCIIKTNDLLSYWYHQMMYVIPCFEIGVQVAYLPFQKQVSSSTNNVFDELPALAAPQPSNL
jgi:hypothetical protein